MKKPESKTKSAETAQPAPAGVASTDSESAELPTTEQLALIAATLARSSSEDSEVLTYAAMELWLSAQKRRVKPLDFWHSYFGLGRELPTHGQLAALASNVAKSIDDDPDKLASAALGIWKAAGSLLEGGHRDAYSEQFVLPLLFSSSQADREGNIPRDVFLKRVVPLSKRSRAHELARIGKAYIRHLFRERFRKEPTEEEFDKFYCNWSAGNVSEANHLLGGFGPWYEAHVKEARRAAGLKSAQARGKRKSAPTI